GEGLEVRSPPGLPGQVRAQCERDRHPGPHDAEHEERHARSGEHRDEMVQPGTEYEEAPREHGRDRRQAKDRDDRIEIVEAPHVSEQHQRQQRRARLCERGEIQPPPWYGSAPANGPDRQCDGTWSTPSHQNSAGRPASGSDMCARIAPMVCTNSSAGISKKRSANLHSPAPKWIEWYMLRPSIACT